MLVMRFIVAAIVAASSLSCQTGSPAAPNSPASTAASWMRGSFSSAGQAAADPSFEVVDLHMTPIWTDRSDGFWFYIEQARAATPAQPYRQRVHRVYNLDDGLVRSDIYELPGDPLRFAGAWRDQDLLKSLRPDQLVIREGCAVTLRPKAGTKGKTLSFEGGTEGAGCESSLRGAAFATSEVTLSNGELRSWDRGWARSGEQVWGPTTGPYIFVRSTPAP